MKTFREFINEGINENTVEIQAEWDVEPAHEKATIRDAKIAHGVTITKLRGNDVKVQGSSADVIKVLNRSAYGFGYTMSELKDKFPELF